MMRERTDCTCPIPFTEDSQICRTCEQELIDLQEEHDNAVLRAGGIDPDRWDEYARQQG